MSPSSPAAPSVAAEPAASERSSPHPVDPLFLDRWSPRAFDASPILRHELLTLFEAARWAPSAHNYQPWRFLYAIRGDEHWDLLLDTLQPFNRAWASQASALVLVLSDTLLDQGKPEGSTPSRTHSFDAGAAWALLALQAIRLGYHTRAMGGIDRDHARVACSVPDRYQIEIAVAIGRRAGRETLPEALRAREVPTGRRALGELVFAGTFGGRPIPA